MTLSDQTIEEFIQIWQAEFGGSLTPEEARMHAVRLIEFYVRVLKPLPKKSHET